MGIWASVGRDGVLAIDLDAPDTDPYGGMGRKGVCVDVATAAPWNDKIRLALFSDGKSGKVIDVCVLLDSDAVRMLRNYLSQSLGEP